MKNKITKKLIIILLLLVHILQITSSVFNQVQANIKEGDKIELKSDHECDSLLEFWMEKYNIWTYKSIWYVYYEDKQNNVRFPAFCVEPKKEGVGMKYDSYDAIISKENNNQIWRILNKGYMGSNYKEWGLECDDDFYSATKTAVHSLVDGIPPTEKYIIGNKPVDGNEVEEIVRRGSKVLEVAQKLYEYGINGKEVYEKPKVSIESQKKNENEKINDTVYYVQEYKVTGNKKIESYEVEIENFPRGTKILNFNNQEKSILSENYFKIAIPTNKIEENIEGKIYIKNASIKTNPIYYCKSTIEGAQSYVTYTTGYEKAETNTTLNLTANNCDLEILKIDKETKKPISNVTFEIRTKNGEYLGKITTDKNGVAKIEKIKPQTIIIKEVQAPENYIVSKEERKITLKWGEKVKVEFENELEKGNLRIIKVDKDNNEILLDGIKFEIYNSNKKLIKKVITDEKGEINIKDLPVGVYTIRETETKENYKLSEDKQVEIKWNETKVEKIENERKKGKIKIIKISEDDNKINGNLKGTPIKDVVFELKNKDGELINTYITNEEGIIITEELEIGKYILKEIKTNKDYILNEDEKIIEIEKDGEIAETIITNKSKEPEKPKLPRTGC